MAPRRSLVVILLAVVAALIVLATVGVTLFTDSLWFSSIGFHSVWSTTLITRAVLFLVFGVAVGAFIVGNLVVAYRLRPVFRPMTQEQQALDEYRAAIEPRMRLLFIVAGVIATFAAGMYGSGHWRTWMMWRNAVPFGQTDDQFHRDIGYFAFTYPFQRMILGLLFLMVAFAIISSAILHYLYGGIRLQADSGERFTRRARSHLLVLLGIFALLKAVAYWLDRYGLAFSERGFVTGPSYTDVHAMLPAKTLLLIIALICSVGIFVAAFTTRGFMRLLPGVSLGLLVLAAVVVGGILPAAVQQFQVKPDEANKESPYIARNIKATRTAYGLDKQLQVVTPDAGTDASSLPTSNDTNVQNVRLLDPNLVSETFRVQEQNRTYYSFQDLLDIDRYTVDGKQQEMVVAARELNLGNLPQDSWVNQHVAYTHGIGVVAAQADSVNANGGPNYTEKDVPPTQTLAKYEPRIYFGERSPNYSIVGAPAAGEPREIDYLPGSSSDAAVKVTYSGKGGVPVGNPLNRLAYALKFADRNILLSGTINGDSKILYQREPRDRVQAAAPWLQLDGDPYPAIIDGKVLWIVDGYTTSDAFPYSVKKQLGDVTLDALSHSSAITAESGQVNYIRNSVKATVDAYDGTVTLYEWDDKDPVLKVWEHAFPNTVKPRTEMSQQLLAHVRYPEDMFKVQRDVLAKYHVTDASTFYRGQDNWQVPGDPGTPNAAAGSTKPDQPPYYLMLQMPGQSAPTFSLTTALVPQGRPNLAAFVSVDSDPGPDYGTIRMIELSRGKTTDGPELVKSNIEATPAVSTELTLLRQGASSVVAGNLLTLPVRDGLLYVQPYYTKATGVSSFPILSRVAVDYGGRVGFAPTLAQALINATTATPGTVTPGTVSPPPPTGTGTPSPGSSATPPPGPALSLSQAIAQLNKAVADADVALKNGDFAAYGDAQKRIRSATDALNKLVPIPATVTPSPTTTSSGG